MSDTPSFDLTREPWIPVLDLAGREQVLSPVEVFSSADDLATVTGELPTTGFALTRLLLAVLHRAVAGPRDADHWTQLWQTPGLPHEEVAGYLDRWRDRWDLLHPTTPFGQVARLAPPDGRSAPLNKVIADVPNGAPLFTTRAGAALERISHAEAARWAVHAQGYDISGIKTGVQGDERATNGKCYPLGTGWLGRLGAVLVEGPTLRDTLLLNLLPYEQDLLVQWSVPELDLPVWERAPVGPGPERDADGLPRNRPLGPADLYTWPSRRLRWTGHGQAVTGVVLTYGDAIPRQNAHLVESMTGWRRSAPQEKARGTTPVYMPREHEVGRVFWRGLGNLLPAGTRNATGSDAQPALAPAVLDWLAQVQEDDVLPAGTVVTTRVLGMAYGGQDASVEEIVSDQLAAPIAALQAAPGHLGQLVVDGVGRAEQGVRALKNLAGNLVRAIGGDGEGARARAEEVAFAALDGPFRRWVATLSVAPEEWGAADARWQRQVGRVLREQADELLVRSGPAGARGRPVRLRRTDQTDTLLDAGLADLWFRTALRTALPAAHPHAPTSPEETTP